jgi:NodT family efflux transporter outer membrane factor (OMF) lipoprotein
VARNIVINNKNKTILIISWVLLLNGCSLFNIIDSKPTAIEIPANWSKDKSVRNSDATSLARWWQRFNDPLLIQLVDAALITNTSVKSAKAALIEARSLRDVAEALLWPTVDGSASIQRSKSGHNKPINNFSVGLDAGWEVDIFGKNRSGLKAAEATAQASEANLGDIQVSISAEVAIDYIALRSAQSRLTIANSNLTSQLETLQITEWRSQAGLVASLDVEQARVSAEQTRSQIPPLLTSIEQLSHALAVLTGQPPASLITKLSIVSPVPKAANNIALNFPAETLRQRPDVRTSELRVSTELALLEQSEAARLPNFKLNGSLGLNALALGSLTSGGSVISSVLANVAMPLFDAGSRFAKVKAQEAVLQQSRFAYQATVLKALQEVEDALVALSGDIQRLSGLMLAADAANSAAVMARQSYESGLIDFQTVLDTQRSLLTTQDSVASAGADLSTDHVRLYKALGGGWVNTNSKKTLN